MKIFLHTANLDVLPKRVSWGIVDGVATNPTLPDRPLTREEIKRASSPDKNGTSVNAVLG